MTTSNTHDPLYDFRQLDINIDDFTHREHLRAAVLMLQRYDFMEAASRYVDCIRALAQAAGAENHFNLTLTLAWLGLISERLGMSRDNDFAIFIEENNDLMEASILNFWYSDTRLNSPLARSRFLLPDRI